MFAVSTYFTVSLLFWYVGLIPDIATMRDRAKSKIRQIAYGIFSLGWRGSHRHWVNYEAAYLLLAAMATPLVLSVHSIVSFDFAVSQLPGWHTTIFPPYFVAGAIFSGFGMVLTLMIPIRAWFGLKHIITVKHLENMAKIILLTGTLVGYAYGMEFFIAWYSGNPYESFAFVNRAFGDYSWAYWIMISCNVITPQFIWSKRIRRSAAALFILSIFVNIGMWFERFVIVATSLHHDFLPSSWDYFSPTPWDIATLVGSFGLFFTLFCLFLRYLPVIAISEVKGVMARANPHFKEPDADRRAVSKSATGVVESREDIPLKRESASSTSSAKVVVSGPQKTVARAEAEDEAPPPEKPPPEDEQEGGAEAKGDDAAQDAAADEAKADEAKAQADKAEADEAAAEKAAAEKAAAEKAAADKADAEKAAAEKLAAQKADAARKEAEAKAEAAKKEAAARAEEAKKSAAQREAEKAAADKEAADKAADKEAAYKVAAKEADEAKAEEAKADEAKADEAKAEEPKKTKPMFSFKPPPKPAGDKEDE